MKLQTFNCISEQATAMAALTQVTLYNWYLIRSGDLDAFDIAIGGYLSNRCIEGNQFETATIVKRLEDFKLLTKDGEIVNLVGAIDVHKTVANGFTLQMAHIFILGFPHIWNFLIGKRLPLKDMGKVTSSQSNVVYDEEIHSQQKLQKENPYHRQQLSAFEGVERHLDSYPEGDLVHGVQYDPSIGAKSFKERSESPIEMEHANFLLDDEFYHKEDPLLSNNMQKKNYDIEKGEGHCTERTESDVQISVSDGVENHPDHVHVQSTVNASIESESRCHGALTSSSVEGFKMAEGELGMAKWSKVLEISSLKRKKDDDCLVGDVEGEELSSAHLSLENPATSVKKISGFDCQHKNEHIISNRSSEKQNNIIAQKLPAEKRKLKRRRKCLLVGRSKRRTKHKVQNHPDQVHIESTVDTAIESVSWCGGALKLMAEERELGMEKLSKTLDISSSEKCKVDGCLVDDAEGEKLSSAHLSLESPGKSPKKTSDSDSQSKDEFIVTNKSTEKQNSIIAQKIPAEKGKLRRRKKCPLARSKRCSRHKSLMQGKNHSAQVHVESISDTSIESVSCCVQTIKLTAVEESEMVEGELRMTKLSKPLDISSLKKNKVDCCLVDDAEGGNLSYAHLSVEIPAKNPTKMHDSDFLNKDKLIITNRSSIAQKPPSKKRTHKQRRKCVVAKSKSCRKHKVENHPDQVHVESAADAAIQYVSWCGGTLKSAAAKGFRKVEGELEMAKLSKTSDISYLKAKKVDGCMVDDAKGKDLSYAHLSLETLAKSPKKMSGSDSPNKDELMITYNSSKNQNSTIAQILTVEKGKSKQRKKCLFAKPKRPSKQKSPEKLKCLEGSSLVQDSSRKKLTGPAHDENGSSLTPSVSKRPKTLPPPPLPSPLVPVPKELVSKAFGLKTSKSGRLLVPPLAHWCGQSLVRDMDGSIVAIEDRSLRTPSETGCFNFKPPIEPESKRLQESLSKMASEYLTKEFNARRRKASWPKKSQK